jgi:RNA recognition motif-containing protein
MTDQCTLFLGDLSILCNENTLRDEFRMRDMAPTAVKIMRIDGRPRGVGFLSFLTKDLAVKAMTEMNGQTVHGRKLRIKFAAYRLPDMTPITTSALIHSVHVKFTTHLMTHFDGTSQLQLPLSHLTSLVNSNGINLHFDPPSYPSTPRRGATAGVLPTVRTLFPPLVLPPP